MVIVTNEKLEAVKVTVQSGREKTVRYIHGADPRNILEAIEGIGRDGQAASGMSDVPNPKRRRKAAAAAVDTTEDAQ